MTMMRSILKKHCVVGCVLLVGMLLAGCNSTHKQDYYGTEMKLSLAGNRGQIWAVAPVINLSGERGVDPLLQADLVYHQLQAVKGLTVVPVNRVVEVYASLGIDSVQSEQQAAQVSQLLGCDALLVTSVTAFDPYNPPKMGAAMQLFARNGSFANGGKLIDPHDLAHSAGEKSDGAEGMDDASLPRNPNILQSVGMFDAADGSVRQQVKIYAAGRYDPTGAMGDREYLQSMDRYCGFVYHHLIADLLNSPSLRR